MTSREHEQKRKEWAERLIRHRANDLTVAQFCDKERVSVDKFRNWSRCVGAVATSGAASELLRAAISAASDA